MTFIATPPATTSHISHTPPTVSVIVCAYTERRWDDLAAVFRSLEAQTTAPLEVIAVIDHNPALLERVRTAFPSLHAIENTNPQGLSGARNAGLEVARGDVIAFLDDDTTTAPDWIEQLGRRYDDANTLAVGGAIKPQQATPAWLPDEFMWVVGCAYRGLPEDTATVRNLFGGNMSFRRNVFEHGLRFRAELGRVGNVLLAGEETDLCIRLAAQHPNGRLVYEPRALVYHAMTPERVSWSYFKRRCYGEGQSKALLGHLLGKSRNLSSEKRMALLILPKGVLRNLAQGIVRRDAHSFARAGAIVVGLWLTGIGYLKGLYRARTAA